MASSMKVSTPELLWHGGGAENGKPDPVFSVDMFDTNILATAGVDENIPPKGSMRVGLDTTLVYDVWLVLS